VVLFVFAITLPCVVIVALGLRLVRQEAELRLQRKDDDRRQAVAEARNAITAVLTRVSAAETLRAADGEATVPPSDLVVLAAPVRGGRLVMPWDANTTAAPTEVHDDPAFLLLQAAEQAEAQRPAQAMRDYRRASASPHPFIAAHARFGLARALAKTGQLREADTLNTALAASPFGITDEYGMPLALYAAQRLADRGLELPAAFRSASRQALHPARWPPPGAGYALHDLASTLSAAPDEDIRAWAHDTVQLASAQLARADRVAALQNDLPALLPHRGSASEARWLLTGDPAWLIGVVPAGPGEAVLLGVDARGLAASLPPIAGTAGVSLVGEGVAGEPLGNAFVGARLSYTPAETRSGTLARRQVWFYGAALVMVLGLSGFGAFLLWRDVRREMRLAAMRGQFVASVSHELKTPLTSIRMFAETLRMGRAMDAVTRDEYLDTIVNESERLTRLLNNVLDFSRIEQERKTYRLEPAKLAEVVRTAARTMEYPLAQERFELRLDLDDTLPPVLADSDAIQQAILNLLTNAMKYSGTSRRIELSLSRDGEQAIVAVTDHGLGIPVNEQPRLFERFYRAQTPENRHVPGTGLGLTIVQHIVAAHRGTVTVESSPGAGSTFRLAFPVQPASDPVVTAAAAGVPS
jgi:two-component system, OmpR family, phosphate regulon sensor histidine kinase PhoR